jgi:hypothetical protein
MYRLDVAVYPPGHLSNRHRSGAAHGLGQFPSRGGENLLQQLWRCERNPRFSVPSPRHHCVRSIGQREQASEPQVRPCS